MEFLGNHLHVAMAPPEGWQCDVRRNHPIITKDLVGTTHLRYSKEKRLRQRENLGGVG